MFDQNQVDHAEPSDSESDDDLDDFVSEMEKTLETAPATYRAQLIDSLDYLWSRWGEEAEEFVPSDCEWRSASKYKRRLRSKNT